MHFTVDDVLSEVGGGGDAFEVSSNQDEPHSRSIPFPSLMPLKGH